MVSDHLQKSPRKSDKMTNEWGNCILMITCKRLIFHDFPRNTRCNILRLHEPTSFYNNAKVVADVDLTERKLSSGGSMHNLHTFKSNLQSNFTFCMMTIKPRYAILFSRGCIPYVTQYLFVFAVPDWQFYLRTDVKECGSGNEGHTWLAIHSSNPFTNPQRGVQHCCDWAWRLLSQTHQVEMW